MGIRFACHSCGKPLNIKNELAGRRGVCPACKVRFRIPPGDADCSIPLEESGQADRDSSVDVSGTTKVAASGSSREIPSDSSAVATMTAQAPVPTNMASTTPEPVAADSNASGPEILSGDEPATWYVRPPSGGQYGPAETKVLRDWIDQGRVAKTALLWRDGWPQWREASEVLAEIADQLPGAMRAPGSSSSGPTSSISHEKTKSIAAEETSPLDTSLAGSAHIGATRRKRTNRRLTLVAVLGALVVGLVVTLFLVASAGA